MIGDETVRQLVLQASKYAKKLGNVGSVDAALAEFDGWLLRVRAGAWDEGFIMGVDSASGDEILSNPYREETE